MNTLPPFRDLEAGPAVNHLEDGLQLALQRIELQLRRIADALAAQAPAPPKAPPWAAPPPPWETRRAA
jgi:hypothetical protein